jgi:hypothetical protein
MEMACELKNFSTHGFHGHVCLFSSMEVEDDKDFVKQDDMKTKFNQNTYCVESSLRRVVLL